MSRAIRDLEELLELLNVDEPRDVHVHALRDVLRPSAERNFRATSRTANVSVTKAEARLLELHGATVARSP